MLNQTTRYALNTLGYLASQRGKRTPGQEVAEMTGVPANYLSKVLNQLRKAGLVTASKGRGGGFELREDALDRPILDVVVMIEGNESLDRSDCLFGLPACDPSNPCPLHPYWEQIVALQLEMYSNVRVRDLLQTRPKDGLEPTH